MNTKYCELDHVEKVHYYFPSINLSACDDCKIKYIKDGNECLSIASMGNSYLCDMRALKDKWTLIYDEICSKQAKIQLVYEKLTDTIIGAFESYLTEINKIKENLIDEINSEKTKFLQSFSSGILNAKNTISKETENYNSHIINIETFLNASVHHLLLPLIQSVDISSKHKEIEVLKESLMPLLISEPIPPYSINKRKYTKESILSLMEIYKNDEKQRKSPVSSIPSQSLVIARSPSPTNTKASPLLKTSPAKMNFQPFVHCFYFGKLYLYDISRDKKYIIDTPSEGIFPTKYFPSMIIKDSIFICGGSSNDTLSFKSTFTFELSTLEFVQRKQMINGKYKHSLALISPKLVYAIGGARNKIAIKECSKYNLETDLWDNAPQLNDEACMTSAFTFKNHIIYIVGGMTNAVIGFVSAIEKLDILNESKGWIKVDFKTNGWSARYAMNSCQLSEQYFLVFGGSNIVYQNHCYLYDAEGDTLMFISRMVQSAKFETQSPSPIIYKDIVYSIDDERNLHMFNVRSNFWSIMKWSQWKPIGSKNQPKKYYY